MNRWHEFAIKDHQAASVRVPVASLFLGPANWAPGARSFDSQTSRSRRSCLENGRCLSDNLPSLIDQSFDLVGDKLGIILAQKMIDPVLGNA